MRTRDLKPGFFRNEELAALQPYARLLYQGLWCMADKRGRLKDSIGLIKSDIFPHENVPVAKHLDALVAAGFVIRYESGNVRYLWLPTFRKNQHPHPKEPESVLPPAAEDPLEYTDKPLPVHGKAAEIPGTAVASPSNTLTTNTLTTKDLTPNPSPPTDPLDAVAASFARFGFVTAGTADAIGYSVKDYTLEWVEKAVRVASGASFTDRPGWNYIESILERWQAQGGPDEPRQLQTAGRNAGPRNNGFDVDDLEARAARL